GSLETRAGLDLPHGTADGPQVLDRHLFVFARDDDTVRAGGKRLQRRLRDGVGIVGRRAGHVEAHAGVDLRPAVRAGPAPRRLAEDVVGREPAAPELAPRGLDAALGPQEVVVQLQRRVERALAGDR